MMRGSVSCCDRLNETTVEPEVFRNMTEFQLPAEYSTFDHSVRLQFPKFSRGFSCSDFKGFIHEHVGEECVVALGRLAFPNEWQLQVNNVEIREKLIRMQKTKINMRTCWISPLSQSEVRGYIHWLPTQIPQEMVLKVLKIHGEVLFIEKQLQTKFESKINSDRIYFALFLRSGKTIDDIPHFINFGPYPGFLSVRGRAPICFHCRVVGHRKSDCKTFRDKLSEYCSNKPGLGKRLRPRGRRFRTAAQIEARRQAEESIGVGTVQSVTGDTLQDKVQAIYLGDNRPAVDFENSLALPSESDTMDTSPSVPAETLPNPVTAISDLGKYLVDGLTNTGIELTKRTEVVAQLLSQELKAKKKKRKPKKKKHV